MEKAKKIKIFLGLFYFISVGLFLYLIFSKFSVNEITSYSFIKNNRDYFFELRNSNLFFLGTIFILFTIIWILALGFLSPLGLFAGFIFGKIYGVIFLISGTAIGVVGVGFLFVLILALVIRNKIAKRSSYTQYEAVNNGNVVTVNLADDSNDYEEEEEREVSL